MYRPPAQGDLCPISLASPVRKCCACSDRCGVKRDPTPPQRPERSQLKERVGAGVHDRRILLVADLGPLAFPDEALARPCGAYFLELGELDGRVRGSLEFGDANGCEGFDKRSVHLFLRQDLSRTPGLPTAPVHANDRAQGCANSHTPQPECPFLFHDVCPW